MEMPIYMTTKLCVVIKEKLPYEYLYPCKRKQSK